MRIFPIGSLVERVDTGLDARLVVLHRRGASRSCVSARGRPQRVGRDSRRPGAAAFRRARDEPEPAAAVESSVNPVSARTESGRGIGWVAGRSAVSRARRRLRTPISRTLCRSRRERLPRRNDTERAGATRWQVPEAASSVPEGMSSRAGRSGATIMLSALTPTRSSTGSLCPAVVKPQSFGRPTA